MIELDEKLARYQEFWDLKEVKKPLIGFDVGGWFPFQRYTDLRNIQEKGFIEPGMLDARRSLPDYAAFRARSLEVPDDFIKGVCPIQAIPWMEGILGCRLQRSDQTVWAAERKASWEELKDLSLSENTPWFQKYIEFVRVLTENAKGEYPVGLPILRGVSDVMGAIRGHTESIMDLLESPDEAKALAKNAADALIKLVKAHHAATVPFHGGHFIEAYSMWAPGPLVRMQEDASAVYSPDLYRQNRAGAGPKDRQVLRVQSHPSAQLVAVPDRRFPRDQGNKRIPSQPGCRRDGLAGTHTIPQAHSEGGRRIFLRGPLEMEDFKLIAKELSPVGLMIQSVVPNTDQAGNYRR